ncbi:glycoside hydrolase family 5 [Bacillus sp. UMB0899]|nr:glycoside hydrolase family 5 [Bacillus sp. UMB0899]
MKNKKIIIFMILVLLLIVLFMDKILTGRNIKELSETVPNNLGIQTHIASSAVDVTAIQNNGFKIVRDDILWHRVEQTPNKYDFETTGYDAYNNALMDHNIRPYYILSYSNSLYEKGNSVVTKRGRKAYTNFVRQAASRYKNQHAIWEIWNEPNSERFWSPTDSSAEKYTQLVKSASKTIKRSDPTGIVVAPALSTIDNNSFDWLEETFKEGILKEIDALSVHLYRGTEPETVIEDYKAIKKLIAKYSDKDIPVLSGEWGYSTGEAFYGVELDQRQQAQYLVRMYLINMYLGIPINIWYDWQGHSSNVDDGEHNFAIREFGTLQPKEASLGASTLANTLNGYRFSKRIDLNDDKDYIFEFINNKDEVIYVCWTQGTEHAVTWPGTEQIKGQVISMLGEQLGVIDTGNTSINLSNSPIYIKY